MPSINRSFSAINDTLVDYLADGRFAQDLEDIALYKDSKNIDSDMIFALVRRLEFVLPDYENILAESIVDSDNLTLDLDRWVYQITETIIPVLLRIFRLNHYSLTCSECECMRIMLLIIVARSREVRTLVMCWLMNRISVESAVDYEHHVC